MLVLIGGSALSAFRVEELLNKCRKLSPGLTELSARTLYFIAVSYTHLRAHETPEHLVCRLLLEKKNLDI